MKQTSKFMSLVLRHKPEEIGLVLDAEGWASVPDLLARMALHGHALSRTELETLVAENDKKRFTLDGDRIRAAQGHSIDVALGLEPVAPPDQLFHGTATRFVDAIRAEGLTRRARQHVHLSPDIETATKVGQRHGKPFIFTVDAARMSADGMLFYRSENGVWLTDHVPAKYLGDAV